MNKIHRIGINQIQNITILDFMGHRAIQDPFSVLTADHGILVKEHTLIIVIVVAKVRDIKIKIMKKHELLEKAMRDYPAGTRFTFYGKIFQACYTSTGVFVCWKDDYDKEAHRDSIWRVDGNGEPNGIVYDGLSKKWSAIITPSLLSGKCAIQVNNAREFKLLMQHYEQRGWKYFSGVLPTASSFFVWSPDRSSAVSYHDGFSHSQLDYFKNEGYKIIPFADFAAEVGIDVPAFVLTSEDEVDLYEGDGYWSVWLEDRKWALNVNSPFSMSSEKSSVTHPNECKAFSTKEAAEAWIAKANKPKEIVLHEDTSCPATITLNGCQLTGNNGSRVFLNPNEIKDIYQAYQSLQEVPNE